MVATVFYILLVKNVFYVLKSEAYSYVCKRSGCLFNYVTILRGLSRQLSSDRVLKETKNIFTKNCYCYLKYTP